MPEQLLPLTGCSGIHLSDLSLSQHSQLDHFWLPIPHCAAIVLLKGRRATPLVINHFHPSFQHHPSPFHELSHGFYTYFIRVIRDFAFSTQLLPRQVEDFPKGDKYFKHVHPLTYLIYFSPKVEYMVGSI